MKIVNTSLIILVLAFCKVAGSLANNVESNTPVVHNEGTELKIVGQGKLKVLFWDVYHSTYYSQTGSYVPEAFPQALKIEYLRDIDADDLIERTADEWKKLNVPEQDIVTWLPLLTKIFPDIKKGDTLYLLVDETKQSSFYYNGMPAGKVADPKFGGTFLRIWLDPNSSYPKVRNQLVGLK